MYSTLLDNWMSLSWEERRRKAKEIPPEVLECFAGAFEGEAKMLRAEHQKNVEMTALRAWQEQKAKEFLGQLTNQ